VPIGHPKQNPPGMPFKNPIIITIIMPKTLKQMPVITKTPSIIKIILTAATQKKTLQLTPANVRPVIPNHPTAVTPKIHH
jgi:hypothetical protein